MKISTFNLNGISHRLPLLLRWLAEAAPDVVCLQELNATNADFPWHVFQEAGYGAIWQGQPSSIGIAILAKGRDPIEIRRGLPSAEDVGCYLEAAVDEMIIGCVYLANGHRQTNATGDSGLSCFEHFIRHAHSLCAAQQPVVLAGDYNVAPDDSDLDDTESRRADVRLQQENRVAYQRLLAQGWIDSLRVLFPQAPLYTFWDRTRNDWHANSGLRVDHLLLSARLNARLIAGGVDTWVRDDPRAGDHAPPWIVLADKRAGTH